MKIFKVWVKSVGKTYYTKGDGILYADPDCKNEIGKRENGEYRLTEGNNVPTQKIPKSENKKEDTEETRDESIPDKVSKYNPFK